jgi:predicted AAA+ superfamily ATPase
MIKRLLLNLISESFEATPICALLGPRQCGKTTLAKVYTNIRKDEDVHFFDLEDPLDLARLDNPKIAFESLKGIIVIDEIQLRPNLFSVLRVIVDNTNIKFLILGSASQELIQQSSETLAGRISYLEMSPFSLQEVDDIQKLWLRGGFPKSYLSSTDKISMNWRKAYVRTFLEKDIPSFGFNISPHVIRRFWMMLTHYHGQVFNASEIGRSIEVTNKTASRYLDILAGTFMVRRLQPWHENISKRQVKSPKIYFRDSGILHALLGIENKENLYTNPKLGISWEGFAVEEIIRFLRADDEDCYFWSTQSGAELDLLIIKNGVKHGFEFKFTDNPKITKSMHIAMQDLKLDNLTIIVPHKVSSKISENISMYGVQDFINTYKEI